jgi:hypothetical protein
VQNAVVYLLIKAARRSTQLTITQHTPRTIPQFECLLFDCVCPAVKALLRNLQEDYLAGTVKGGILGAAGLTTRVLRVARVLLLQYATLSARMLGEVDLLVTLMLHSMQPYRGDTDSSSAPDGLPASGDVTRRCCSYFCI